MAEPAKKIETQSEPKRSASPLEMLGELANERRHGRAHEAPV